MKCSLQMLFGRFKDLNKRTYTYTWKPYDTLYEFVFSMYETLNPIGFIDGKPYDRCFWDTVEFSHQRLDLKKSGAPRLSANGFRQRVSKNGLGWLVGW